MNFLVTFISHFNTIIEVTAQYGLYVTRCVTQVQWFDSRYRQENFLYSEVLLILAVGPNQFPIQGLPAAFSVGLKGRGS